jgi:hypothetical protein
LVRRKQLREGIVEALTPRESREIRSANLCVLRGEASLLNGHRRDAEFAEVRRVTFGQTAEGLFMRPVEAALLRVVANNPKWYSVE